MIGESEIANAPCIPLLHKESQQTVIDEAFFQHSYTVTASNGMQQIIVNVVSLQPLQRILIHLLALF